MNYKIKRQLILLPIFLSLGACATGVIPPAEVRQKEYMITTTAKKADAYSKALAHLSKQFGDANSAIKVKNEASGQIVAKGAVLCNELPGDYVSNFDLSFDLDFQAKDNKARLLFEDLLIKYSSSDKLLGSTNTNYGRPAPAHMNIKNKEDVEKVGKCLQVIVDGVTKSINGKDW